MSNALEVFYSYKGSKSGFEWLRPSKVLCLSKLSRVEVEWRAGKPCWVEERGRKGVILSRTSISKILDGIQRKQIGSVGIGKGGGFARFQDGDHGSELPEGMDDNQPD